MPYCKIKDRFRTTKKTSCLFRYQFLKFHLRGIEQFYHRIFKQIWVTPVIESPLKFVKVRLNVLGADLMKRTDDRPFKEAPGVFNSIGVDIAPHILIMLVVDNITVERSGSALD